MEAAKRAHPRAKRRKLQLEHSDEQRNTTMEQLPEDAMVLIISFLCYGSIQDIAGLYCRFGRVSRFCRRSSIRFPQLVPVEWYDDSGEATLVTVRTFRVVAFLCHNPIKVKSFGALKFTSDLDVNIISYMMKECNISCLREIKLEFNEVGDFTKSSDYEKTIAIAAGIPEDAVYSKENNGTQEDVQRQIAQILSERARCIKNLTIYAKSFHVDLPRAISTQLEFVHLHFNDWIPPGDSDGLSRTIEALPRLRHLSLFSKGDLSIRSKSLEQLNYWGDEGPQECICPLLKVLKLTVLEPGTPKLLSSFVHAIKKFKLEIAADGRIHDWEEEHWERWRNATLRYTQIIEAMPELRHFWMRDDQIYGAIKELRIRSASLETISIVESPYCKFRECICPCLKSLQCVFFAPSKSYQLLLTNNDTAAHIYKYRRKSIKSINCPCVGIEVSDDCMLIFKRKKMTMVLT
eukprot:scaffold3110_cov153-Chaetoceros_neogracile.AAC.1